MKAVGLLLVFVTAKLAVLIGQPVPWSLWIVAAYFWQDVLTAALFGAFDAWLRARGHSDRVSWVIYWALAIYAALNVSVERALFTPLTWPMLNAARGPLTDSLRLYATPENFALMALPVLVGALPLRLKTHDRLATISLLIAAVPITAAGWIAGGRVDTLTAVQSNVVAALVASSLPRVTAQPRLEDWRHSRFDAEPTADLSRLRGIAKGRNIITVSLESTAAQYLGVYGAMPDTAPNLTALARDAVVFEEAYAVYPESIKGLFSVLCSQSPAFDTAAEQYAAVPCDSVAASLRKAGYRTGLFHSGRFGYLGMESVIRDRGYDVLEDAGDIGGQRQSSFGVDEASTVQRMLAWIDSRPAGQSFFLTYLPIAGHHPYEAPGGGPFPTEDDLGRYQNAIHDGDASLGALVEGLRARGIDRNTVWIIFGDHGEAFGQHQGNFGHTFHVYEENVHVPFVIAAPGVLHGQTRARAVVSLIDTAPTIIDLAGLPAPSGTQGVSALGPPARMALFFADYATGVLGLRDGPWKFIYEMGPARSRLFELTRDPLEQFDVSSAHPDRVSWYQDRLERWAAAQKSRVLTGMDARSR